MLFISKNSDLQTESVLEMLETREPEEDKIMYHIFPVGGTEYTAHSAKYRVQSSDTEFRLVVVAV